MRAAFIDELCAAAAFNPKIVLIIGDLGFNSIEPFPEKFPDRFFNAGICEQSMMSMAAGMASEGFHVFVYSIANFVTWRCAEQIRNDVDHHNFPVTIVGVGGGTMYGKLGYSHHALQDMGLMRLLPNMLIAAPGDEMETRACTRYLIENPQPSYLRLGKAPCRLHDSVPQVAPGRWLWVISEGNPYEATLTTGTPTVASTGLRFTMPLWGEQWKSMQELQVLQYHDIRIAEDHYTAGGFGSWMLEALPYHLRERIDLMPPSW